MSTMNEATELNAAEDAKMARLDEAGSLISSAARWSVAATLIPVPYLDMAGLAAVQTSLILDISKLYGQQPSKQAVSGAIAVLLGVLVPQNVTGAVVSSGVKMFPGAGTVIGAASMAAFGSAATYAIGKVFVRHFENGGSFSTFSTEKVQADLKKEFASASEAGRA